MAGRDSSFASAAKQIEEQLISYMDSVREPAAVREYANRPVSLTHAAGTGSGFSTE